MNFPRFAVGHQPIVLFVVLTAMLVGIFNLATMPRREDPQLTIRDALVVTEWPGSPAEKIDELLTEPLETAIIEVADVATVRSKSLTGVSVIQITLEEDVRDSDQIWDDLRAKVRAVEGELPPSAGKPWVNSDYGDVFEIVLAIYQLPPADQAEIVRSYTPRELEMFAERIEDELELITSVSKVSVWGARPERIYVEMDSADLAKLQLTAIDLRRTFEARNIVTPGGELNTARARYSVAPSGELSSVAQIRELIVARRNGEIPIRLGDLPVRIDRRYEEPPKSLTRFSAPGVAHRPSVVVAVSMKSGRNVASMSAAVDQAIDSLRKDVLPADLGISRVNDLPRQVNERIGGFQVNLLQGVGIVLLVAFLIMGWRPALIMAAAVPLSMLSAIAVVRAFGVELEQFAIASLIIALGLIVDNAVVISDNVVRLLNQGVSKFEACIRGAQDLAAPILTATVTTVFAFLPMLTIEGYSGEYIRSLPIVVSATLAASYLLAMTVTPITCLWLLRAPENAEPIDSDDERRRQPSGLVTLYERMISWSLRRRGVVLLATAIAFLASLGIVPVIGTQFFPSGDRDQFFVKIWLPEGAPIEATAKVADTVEREILDLAAKKATEDSSRLNNIATYVGSGGPQIMLTQEPEFDYPNYALLVVNTTDLQSTDDLADALQRRVVDYPDARITVEKFVLGPPIKDPITFRLSGPNADILRRAGGEMVAFLKQTPGAEQVHSNWGSSAYQVDIEIDDDAVNLAGVTHEDIALTTQAILSGAPLTRFREGDHIVPVLFRTTRERREDLGDLAGLYVSGSAGQVPLDAVARLSPSWQPAAIARRNHIQTITVSARPTPGTLANVVASRVRSDMEALAIELGPQYRLEQGGEHEETVKAMTQVARAVVISIVLILFVLIVQYNQLLKPLIILLTIPLATIGVLVGLLVTGWAMGFMATLGILALGGIVINNAIVLIDFIEKRVAGGTPLQQAVIESGRLRMRPIILTSLTTIGGLLPLSLFGGPLWAPMTNGMIFGLIFATVLTLIVVPVLFVTFAERFGMRVT